MENPAVYENGKLSAPTHKQLEMLMTGIEEAANKLTQQMKDNGYNTYSIDYIINYVYDNHLLILVENTYLVLLDVASHWATSNIMLTEEAIFRLNKSDYGFSYVTDCMKHVARELGCTTIQVGTIAALGVKRRDILARLYERGGFVRDQINLHYEVDHG